MKELAIAAALAVFALATPAIGKPAHAGCGKPYRVQAGQTVIWGTSGDDCINLRKEAGPFEVHGVAGNDVIVGSNGDDVIYSGWLPNVVDGGPGNDTYVLDSNSGADLLADSGGGVDTIIATGGLLRLRDFTPAASIERIVGTGTTRIIQAFRGDQLDFSATILVGIECIYGDTPTVGTSVPHC